MTNTAYQSHWKLYWPYKGEFSLSDDQLLLCGQRIVSQMPSIRKVLEQLHIGHQGITTCWEWAKQSVWWPELSKHATCWLLSQNVSIVPRCVNKVQNHFCQVTLPAPPWQNLAVDFFGYKSWTYMYLLVHSLLLSVRWTRSAIHNDFHRDYLSFTFDVCPTQYSWWAQDWQRKSIHVQGIPTVYARQQNFTHHQQPTVSPGKWHGWHALLRQSNASSSCQQTPMHYY